MRQRADVAVEQSFRSARESGWYVDLHQFQ
jgi:hypothetical protein